MEEMKKSTRILLLLLLAASPPPQFPLELVFYHEPQLSWCLTSSVSRSVRRGAFVLPFIVSAYFKLSDRLRGSLAILNQKHHHPRSRVVVSLKKTIHYHPHKIVYELFRDTDRNWKQIN